MPDRSTEFLVASGDVDGLRIGGAKPEGELEQGRDPARACYERTIRAGDHDWDTLLAKRVEQFGGVLLEVSRGEHSGVVESLIEGFEELTRNDCCVGG